MGVYMEALITKLVGEFQANQEDKTFPDRARAEITAYKPNLRGLKASPIDPERYNSRASALSRLKKRCMEVSHFHPDMDNEVEEIEEEYGNTGAAWEEWDSAKTLNAVVKLQRQWKYDTGLKGALAHVSAVPELLKQVQLTKKEKTQRSKLQDERKTAKLDTVKDVNVDLMLNWLMPSLTTRHFKDTIPALLLATGRRQTEILKTAEFTKTGPYQVKFTGQLKSVGAPFIIDLLAPADLCIAALQWVRNTVDCTKMSPAQVNHKYSNKIGTAVAVAVGMKPHALRGINAMACHQLFHREKSLIGYMRQQLGHTSEESTARYQPFVITVTKPWVEVSAESKEEKREEPSEEKEDLFGLEGITKPERKKVAQIAMMMKQGKWIPNAHAVQKECGGSYPLINRVMDMPGNRDIIELHNKAYMAKRAKK